MNIYITNIKKRIDDEQFLELLKLVDVNYQRKILRYRFWEDRQRSLYGHLLARYAIKELFHLKNDKIKIAENSYGKPYVVGHHEIHYNVSHSGDWVVCAVNTAEVGVDVQEIKKIKLAIAERFFSEEENAYLAALTQERQQCEFYDTWSLKEAYVKAIGVGLSQPLNEFSVTREEDRFHLRVKETMDSCFFFKQYHIGEKYRLSVCSKENNFCDKVQELSLHNIMMAF